MWPARAFIGAQIVRRAAAAPSPGTASGVDCSDGERADPARRARARSASRAQRRAAADPRATSAARAGRRRARAASRSPRCSSSDARSDVAPPPRAQRAPGPRGAPREPLSGSTPPARWRACDLPSPDLRRDQPRGRRRRRPRARRAGRAARPPRRSRGGVVEQRRRVEALANARWAAQRRERRIAVERARPRRTNVTRSGAAPRSAATGRSPRPTARASGRAARAGPRYALASPRKHGAPRIRTGRERPPPAPPAETAVREDLDTVRGRDGA